MKTLRRFYFVAFSLTVATFLFAQQSKWPVVQPLEEKQSFIEPGQNNTDTPFVIFIKMNNAIPAYKLECHNGNYDDMSEINFSGDFQCALFAVKGRALTSSNLLAANSKSELSTDWWNRGRMRSVQLRGECLKYPEYSTVRHFKLRGMLLTLRFTEVEWSSVKDQQNNPLIRKFTITVNVVSDPTAKSSRAEDVQGPAPPKACYP